MKTITIELTEEQFKTLRCSLMCIHLMAIHFAMNHENSVRELEELVEQKQREIQDMKNFENSLAADLIAVACMFIIGISLMFYLFL